MWVFYWWFQSLVNAGIFCLGMFHLRRTQVFLIARLCHLSGHDAGHSTLYESNKINNTLGFILHSVIRHGSVSYIRSSLVYFCP